MTRTGHICTRRTGFTLVEMLVTLALTAMISSVLWQAMQQITRVERLLQRSGVDGQLDLVRREWLRSLLQSALVEQIGSPRQFVGDGQQLALASSESLAVPGLSGRTVRLRLETDPATRRQRLLVVDGQAKAVLSVKEAAPVELLSWTGAEGHFRYLDADGAWLDQWPPAKSTLQLTGDPDLDFLREAQSLLPLLPRAVWIDLGAELGGPLVAQISTTQVGRGRLLHWEGK
jgi:prepilin-type N-terminal cleavage/methylation domain-containing protein